MKKLFVILLTFCFAISCSQTRPVKNCDTFTEMDDPEKGTLSSWGEGHSGKLLASFGDIDRKYPKSQMPTIKVATTEHKVTGWKGEKLSAQIILSAPIDVSQIEFEFSDFKSKEGTLPSSIGQARFVRYVMTDEFGKGCGKRKPEDFKSSLAPDMLDNLECFNMEAKTSRPVWITVEIPRTANAGTYEGTIKLYARDQKTQNFKLTVEVLNQTLPQPSEWKFHLDQWQHPSAVARVHNLEVWSDAHFDKMKPLMKLLADAGQKVITTNINKEPWNHQCFDAYEDMIIWTKNEDGTWTYDYTVFDRWVQFMMDLGVNKMINCYSMVPWNNELHYTDAKTGEIIDVKADPGTKEFEEMWSHFLPDFSKHLKEKGWIEITNIAMDERSPESIKATIAIVEKYAPEIGVALADNHQSYKRYPFIKDMCVAVQYADDVELKDILARKEKGLNTTYYSYCGNEFPNMFTFSQNAESTFIGWYAAAAQFDGYLRWAYNSWVENPILDSRFRTWPAGDTYIVYPDARASIRYERMVEGIQDFEKIHIIRKQLTEKGETQKLKMLDDAIAKLKITKRNDTWNTDLNKAKEILNEVSK